MKAVRFSPRNYIITTFVISCLLLSILSFMMYRQYESLNASSEWTINRYENMRKIYIAFSQVQDLETGYRGYFLTGSLAFLEPFVEAYPQIMTNLEATKKFYEEEGDSGSLEDLKELETMVSSFKTELEAQLHIYNTNGKITVKDLSRTKNIMDRIRTRMEEIISMQLTKIRASFARYNDSQSNYQVTLLVGTLLAIGGLFVANMIIIALINRGNRYEEQFKATEESYRLAMTGINDGLCDYDFASDKSYYSQSYKKLLGYELDELPGMMQFYDVLLHPDEAEGAKEEFRKFANREIPEYRRIVRLKQKNGNYRWFLSRRIGIWDQKGKLKRFLGVITDINDQKKREEELRAINSEMENFTYIASHDLRSPLVNLKGFAGEIDFSLDKLRPILKSVEGKLDEDERKTVKALLKTDIPEALKFIRKAVERMDSITSAILEISRIGKKEIKADIVNVGMIVDRCVATQNYEINNRKIEVTINELPQLISDSVLIEQIFANIIENAVKYFDPSKPKPFIKISGEPMEGEVLYKVEDNGLGIPEGDQHKVFSFFRRASNAGTERGAGMGMAYVQTTVRKLQGYIWFESELGKGTIFYLRLPDRVNTIRKVG